MKQQDALSASSSLTAVALALVLAGCAGGQGSMSMAGSTPASSTSVSSTPAPRPVALNPSAVGSAREVPAALRTPVGQSMFLLVSGVGVQIYECAAKPGAAGGFGWTFRSPEATLTDASGVTIGKHYAGPTWESADGSTVVGTVAANDPGPDASAIPWLLLTVKSTTGSGVFTQTKSVQRLQTVGGVMPTTPCAAGNAGAMSRVPYAATYAFFRVGT